MQYYEVHIDGAWSGDVPKSLKKVQADFERISRTFCGHKCEIVKAPPFLEETLVKRRLRNKVLSITNRDGNERLYSKIRFKTEQPDLGWYFQISDHHTPDKLIRIDKDVLTKLVWEKLAYDETNGLKYKLYNAPHKRRTSVQQNALIV